MTRPVSVALCFDRHFALPATTAIASVMRRCSQPVRFHLIIAASPGLERFLHAALARFGADGTIVQTEPERALNVDENSAYGVPSTATYRRLFLDRLLPDLDRVIYLDCDLIVRHDLSELWRYPLDGHALGAVADAWAADNETMRKQFPRGYFNSGVLLMDLARWRALALGEKFADAIRGSPVHGDSALRQYDQGPLNECLGGDWQSLPPRWNFTAYFTDAAAARLGLSPDALAALRLDPGIVHFVGGYKPWLDDFARLSRYHREFVGLRAELEQSIDLGEFGWPGRFFGRTHDRRQRRICAMSLVDKARRCGPRRWTVVAKGLVAVDVLAVAREQGLDIACLATENPLFGEGQFGDFAIYHVADEIRRGRKDFLIADYQTAAATAARVAAIAARLGAEIRIVA